MSVSISIKDQIIQRINALSTVEVVYPAMKLNPSGFPCVYVTTNTEEGEFASNAENSRVYTYTATVLFPLGQDFVPDSEKERLDYAERTVAEVIDQIITSIDEDFTLGGGATVLFTNAADVEWGYMDYEGGAARAANVTLRVYTEIVVV